MQCSGPKRESLEIQSVHIYRLKCFPKCRHAFSRQRDYPLEKVNKLIFCCNILHVSIVGREEEVPVIFKVLNAFPKCSPCDTFRMSTLHDMTFIWQTKTFSKTVYIFFSSWLNDWHIEPGIKTPTRGLQSSLPHVTRPMTKNGRNLLHDCFMWSFPVCHLAACWL